MTCTRCKGVIRKGVDRYHRTSKGSHHATCANAIAKRGKVGRHPHQPVIKVAGVLRFKENAIVSWLHDMCGSHKIADMNSIALLPFSREDRVQFAQLIGYSVSGFGELSYVSDKVYAEATESSS